MNMQSEEPNFSIDQGVCRSKLYNDVYFSVNDAWAESYAVFIKGNRLEERLSALEKDGTFVVGETGFGAGRNLLVLEQIYLACAPEHTHLKFVSIEKHPLSASEAGEILANISQADLSGWLSQWPPQEEGSYTMHRSYQGNRSIEVTLLYGDAGQCLSQYHPESFVQAWFLDGFSPSCNTEMWSASVMDQVKRLSSPEATVASYTVAGTVRRALQQRGFVVTKMPGHGKKRHRLEAMLECR